MLVLVVVFVLVAGRMGHIVLAWRLLGPQTDSKAAGCSCPLRVFDRELTPAEVEQADLYSLIAD